MAVVLNNLSPSKYLWALEGNRRKARGHAAALKLRNIMMEWVEWIAEVPLTLHHNIFKVILIGSDFLSFLGKIFIVLSAVKFYYFLVGLVDGLSKGRAVLDNATQTLILMLNIQHIVIWDIRNVLGPRHWVVLIHQIEILLLRGSKLGDQELVHLALAKDVAQGNLADLRPLIKHICKVIFDAWLRVASAGPLQRGVGLLAWLPLLFLWNCMHGVVPLKVLQ